MSIENNITPQSVNLIIDISTIALVNHIRFLENTMQELKDNVKKYIKHDMQDMARSCERTINGILIALGNAKNELSLANRTEKIILQEKFFNLKSDSFTSKTKKMDPNEAKNKDEQSSAADQAVAGSNADQPTTSGDAEQPAPPPDEKPAE